jgi:hypothetical protein
MDIIKVAGLAIALAVSTWAAAAEPVELKADHPERYTVVKGDTLWDIAGRFLDKPWRWPEIWKVNPQIENPHWIYPGDVLVLTVGENGPELKVLRKTVKLSPAIYSKPYEQPIPTIPPDLIRPYLTQPLVLGPGELERAGYITVGLDDKILLGKYSEFYARGLAESKSGVYQIFRQGKEFTDPETAEPLGYEALYLGEARMVRPGDPAKLEIISSTEEIGPSDRLLPSPEEIPTPLYQPHAPDHQVHGRILSALNAVSEMGPTTVVAINLGTRDGMEPGHVLRIMRHGGERPDRIVGGEYQLPEEESGLLMVFRTFDRVSYALVMKATRSINVLDAVRTP